MTIGYLICLIASVGLLVAYTLLMKKREFWLAMLHVCVVIVNLGYFLTSIAKTVEFAIFGNDVTYFGSVFLCMCMLLTIIRLCGFEVKKRYVITCLSLGFIMFAIIASSPMLPLYYTSLNIENIEGATKLDKKYGVLHPVYTVYLIVYFAAMIVTIIYSIKKKKLGKPRFACFIAAIVGMNIAVWLFEKFVNWEYEFLSVIYVGSEILLIFVYWMIQEYVHKTEVPPPIVKEVEVIKEIEVIKEKQTVVVVNSEQKAEMINRLLSVIPDGKTLTVKEIEILESLVDGKSRKEIAAENHVSENTIKTHVSHIYEKFGVSSRESLMALLEK